MRSASNSSSICNAGSCRERRTPRRWRNGSSKVRRCSCGWTERRAGGAAGGAIGWLGPTGAPPGHARPTRGRAGPVLPSGPPPGAGRPLLPPSLNGSAPPLRGLLLPFELEGTSGALHLVFDAARSVTDEDFELARTIALLVGVALASARQRSRLVDLARLKG